MVAQHLRVTLLVLTAGCTGTVVLPLGDDELPADQGADRDGAVRGPDGGILVVRGDGGAIGRTDAGDVPFDAWVPPEAALAYAVSGTHCTSDGLVRDVVLSPTPMACDEAAATIGSAPAGTFVATLAEDERAASGPLRVCRGVECVDAQLTVSLSSVAPVRGTWTADVDGVAVGEGAVDATACDFDALLPAPEPVTASGLVIDRVSLYQGVEIPLADRSGSVATPRVLAGRPGLVRVFVTPQAGFVARQIIARFAFESGETRDVPLVVRAASRDADRTSTFELPLEASDVTPGRRLSVHLVEADACAAEVAGSVDDARVPASGTLSLSPASAPGPFHLTVVPMRMNGRTPSLGAAMVAAFRDQLMRVYPVVGVEVTVRAAVDFDGAVAAGDNGAWDDFLEACLALRAADRPAADEYYYCAASPEASFATYCGRSCITGLAPVAPTRAVDARAGTGIVYPAAGDYRPEDTMVHEIGHALGRSHAPCGGVSGADPGYPDASGNIVSWGYDVLDDVLIDPRGVTDFMGYCSPTWTSAYGYGLAFTRLQSVLSGDAADRVIVEDVEVASIVVHGDGTMLHRRNMVLPSFQPDGLFATVYGPAGAWQVEGMEVPIADGGGSILYVPVPDPGWISLAIDGRGTVAREAP